MYYTLTLNPAIDYIINVETLSTGELNRTVNEKFLPGGKGINVSAVLSSFGVNNLALGFAAGFTGKELERMLYAQNIKSDFIYLTKGNTRINVKIKENNETEINADGPKIEKEDLKKLFKKLNILKNGDFLILSGSIPKSVSQSVYLDIAEYISCKKINLVIDAEKELLLPTLKYCPFLIKPNLYELEAIFEKKLLSKEEIVSAARKLQNQGAKNVFVSLGSGGGIFLSEEKEVFFSPAPCGKLINSTGAGDSAVAGFLAQYEKDKNYRNAFLMGICSGSASAFSENLATKEDAETLYRHHIVERLEGEIYEGTDLHNN